jgi:preprotein translocase subunit SecE
MSVRRHVNNRKATHVTENNTPDAVAGQSNSDRKTGVVGRVSRFLREVIIELRKVVTPTRKELINFTIVVLVFVVIVMALITSLDFVIGLLTGFVFGDGTFSWGN